MLIRKELSCHFVSFCNQMLDTRDYDPNYFIVRGVSKLRKLSMVETFNFCIVFNGFYNFNSAEKFLINPEIDVSKLIYGVSRRGFRANYKVLDFISIGKDLFKTISIMENRKDAWNFIYNRFLNIPGCGHWSAYYLTDMMKVVLGFKITAPNFGFLGSGAGKTGPLAGLEFLTDISMDELGTDEKLQQRIFQESLEKGIRWTGMEEMESCLCNFLSLYKNKYYVGRDIDRQPPMMSECPGEYWEARRIFFPDECLGELNGFYGIRKEKMGFLDGGKTWNKKTDPWI